MADDTDIIEPVTDHEILPAPAPEPVSGMRDATAAEELFKIETALFGTDIVRIDGKIEKGIGSRYQSLEPDQRAHYDAVENLVAMEADLAAAESSAAVAAAKVEEQRAKVEAARDANAHA